MDLEIVYALLGIVVLLFVIAFTLSISPKRDVQTKEGKKDQIIQQYKKRLKESLDPLKDDKQAYLNKKSELLKKFSSELSRNIFFDASEIKDIVLKLSKEH